jgi:hypothetical protein
MALHPLTKLPDNLMQSPGNPSLRELNEIYSIFHREQSRLLRKRIVQPDLFKIASRNMNSEAMRGVGVREMQTWEEALEQAEKDREDLAVELIRDERRRFSVKGGRAPKGDTLSSLIEGFVRLQSDLTENSLLGKLKARIGEGVIISIDKDDAVLSGDRRKIKFYKSDGGIKEVSVSGLKDRLSRVKKKIKSR